MDVVCILGGMNEYLNIQWVRFSNILSLGHELHVG